MMRTAVDQWGLKEAVPVSASTGDGCDVLLTRVLHHLPEGPPLYPEDVLTDQPMRSLAAEWVREKILHRMREEIPHAAAVSVDRWVERADGLIEIEATIFVERDSQKGIVIGKGGGVLKEVGTEARADLERMLERRVFLSLRVEVHPDWRNDPRMLGNWACYDPRFVRQRRDEAYVLGVSELGEADLIVTLLAEHHGRVRGVAASAKKSRRRFGGALEPMTRVSASWVTREGRELHRIESLEPVRSFATMQSDPARQAACAVLCEITAATIRDEQPEEATFRLLGAVLEALEAGLHPWLAVRYAEYWTAKLHGVLPDLSHCGECGEPFVPGQGLRCAKCGKAPGAVALRPAELEALRAFDKNPPKSLDVPKEIARPNGPLEMFLRGTIEAFAERSFRSYRHLRAATS